MGDILDTATWAVLFLLCGTIAYVATAVLRRRQDAAMQPRQIPGFTELRQELKRAAESGKPLHIALGSGQLGSIDTVTSLAGLQVLEGLIDEALRYHVAPVVTVGDPALLLLAQDIVRRSYRRDKIPESYDPNRIRFVAPSSLAYAAGAIAVGAPEPVAGNVAVGSFGADASLFADASDQRGGIAVAAVDAPQAIGALYPATDRLAVGEELYAAGAELTGKEAYTTGLFAQDVLRVLLALTILSLALITFLAHRGI